VPVREALRVASDTPGEVQATPTVQEATELLAGERWDVVLLDLTCSDGDGVAAAQCVCEAAAGIPVLVLVGMDDTRLSPRVIEAGACGCLSKENLTEQRLGYTIRQAVERARIQRSSDELRMAEEIVSALPTGMLIYQYREPDELLLVSGNAAATPFVDAEMHRGNKFASHWPSPMVERLEKPLLGIAREGGVLDRETVVPTGETFQLRAFRIPGERVAIAFEDITQRKQAEEALGAEEEKYRQLFEHMLNGFALHEVVVDESGQPADYVFLEVNTAFERMTGLSREEILGRRATEVLPGIEGDPADWIGRYGEIALNGGQIRFEQYSEPLSRWYSVLAFSTRTGQFATVIEEITDRVLATRAVAEWKTRYEAAVEASHHILYDWDCEANTVMYGGDLKRILGYSEEEMAGGLPRWIERIHRDDRDGFVRAIEHLRETRDVAHLSYRVRRKNGEYIHVEDDGQFIVESDGRSVRMLGFVKDVTAQRRAAAQLETSERRYRSIFEMAPMGIVTVNLRGVVTSCNRAFAEMTGYDVEELADHHFSKLPPARLADMPKYVRAFRSILVGRPVERFRACWTKKDGTPRIGDVRVGVMKWDGKLRGVQVVVQDITDRIAAEDELRESETRYRSLFEDAILGIYQTTPDGKILAANPALIRMLGYDSFEELAARNLESEGYEPETPREAFKRRIERDGVVTGVEAAWTRRDGATIYVRENARAVRDDAGEVLHYEGTIEDITEQREAQREAEALREQLELTQHSVDSTEAVILWVRPDGRFIFVNDAACRMLEYSHEELLRLTVWDLDPEYPKEGRGSEWEALKRIETEVSERTFRRRDGDVFPVELTAQYLEFQGQELEFVVAFDISERKRLEAQLQQSQKLESIGTLASGVAHEINNPLTGIINYAQLIGDRIEDEKLAAYAAGIKEEGLRVAKIVRNLLSFSRHEQERLNFARMADIVDDSLSLYAALLRRDRIALSVDVPDDLPAISCRSQEIQQVLINLLTNARDALNLRYPGDDKNKRIEIRARAQTIEGQDWLRLEVSDQGVGIEEAIVDRIFDPFFTTKSRDQGTGLGLSVSYGLVRDHGGRMSVESTPGDGAVFRIDLPLY